MKHAYVIRLFTKYFNYHMPYIFTSEKEAYLYGEYKFRTQDEITAYEVERYIKLTSRFYALK